MYKIKKVPSPTGYTVLDSEVTVESVDGIENVYMDDGELRGKVTLVSSESTIEITYKRKYQDGRIRDFIVKKSLKIGDNDFSLSEAPMFNRGLESVSISVKLI